MAASSLAVWCAIEIPTTDEAAHADGALRRFGIESPR